MSVQANGVGRDGNRSGGMSVPKQLIGAPVRVHLADQPETSYRCDGRLHDPGASNMWSCSTKFCAYFQ